MLASVKEMGGQGEFLESVTRTNGALRRTFTLSSAYSKKTDLCKPLSAFRGEAVFNFAH